MIKDIILNTNTNTDMTDSESESYENCPNPDCDEKNDGILKQCNNCKKEYCYYCEDNMKICDRCDNNYCCGYFHILNGNEYCNKCIKDTKSKV